MLTRTKTTIKIKTMTGMNMDIEYPKGTNVKGIIIDLINFSADDDLDKFQEKINERIDFIRLNN